MSAVLALHSDLRGSNGSTTSVSDDAGNHNQLANQVALEVSQHSGVLITVNLHLELRNRVSLLEVLREIVSLVHLLHCFLELSLHDK